MHWVGLMPVRRASGPCLWPIVFTYKTILPTYPVVCIHRNFGQGPSPLMFPYIILTHWDALNMSWNQDWIIVTSCLSEYQGLGYLNIWEPLLFMPEKWAWSGTHKLKTSALNFILYLMTILRLYMKDSIKNLQFVHNLSPFNSSIMHIMMMNMYLTFLVSGWIQNIWKPEGVRKSRDTPISQFRRKSGLMSK